MSPTTADRDVGVATVTADVVVLTVREGRLHVLLTDRGNGHWGLPSAAKRAEESLTACAVRRVEGELGLPLGRGHLEQLATYGDPGRDPDGHAISVAHVALVPSARLDRERADARFWAVDDLADGYGPPLVLDHGRILDDALGRTRAKLEYTTLATRFVDDPFTIGDLYDVYRAVWGTDPGDKANFARKVKGTAGFVVPSGRSAPRSGRGRPPVRYLAGPATYLHPPILRPTTGT